MLGSQCAEYKHTCGRGSSLAQVGSCEAKQIPLELSNLSNNCHKTFNKINGHGYPSWVQDLRDLAGATFVIRIESTASDAPCVRGMVANDTIVDLRGSAVKCSVSSVEVRSASIVGSIRPSSCTQIE